MNVKKRSLAMLTALMLVLSVLAFLPDGMLRAGALDSITGVHCSSNDELFWDAFPGASYYRVEWSGKNSRTSNTYSGSFTINASGHKPEFKLPDTFPAAGIVYNINIAAVGSGGKVISETYTYRYNYRGVITNLKLSSSMMLTWDAFPGDFDHYSVDIREEAKNSTSGIRTTDNYADISEYMKEKKSGTYKIWISASKDMGTWSEGRGESEVLTLEHVNTDLFIDKTTVRICPPVIGGKPDFDPKIALNDGDLALSDAVESTEVRWVRFTEGGTSYDYTLNADDRFEEGREYAVYCNFTLKKDCHIGKINDPEDESSINGVKTRMMLRDEGYSISAALKLVPPVNITVPEPKAGEIITDNQYVISVTPSDAGIKVFNSGSKKNKVSWSLPPYMIQEGVTKFQSGKTYTLKFKLTQTFSLTDPLPDFSLSERMLVKVNGREAEYTGNNGIYYTYQLKFTVGGAKGDVNSDSKINMKDLVLLRRYLNKWDVVIDTYAADVNSDSHVNLKDLVLLQRYLNKWDVTLG